MRRLVGHRDATSCRSPVDAIPGPAPQHEALAARPLTAAAARLHSPDAHWLALRDGMAVARASLWWTDLPPWPDATLGYIGHYAAADGDAARALLGHAAGDLAARGCTLAVGPIDGSTWRSYRLVVEPGDRPPFFLEPHNPPDWPDHFRAAGFDTFATYTSALVDAIDPELPKVAAAATRLEAAGYRFRALDLSALERELHQLFEVSLAAFAANLLYAPIAEREFLAQYEALLPKVDPRLVLLAEHDDRIVGYVFAVPDLLEAAPGQSPAHDDRQDAGRASRPCRRRHRRGADRPCPAGGARARLHPRDPRADARDQRLAAHQPSLRPAVPPLRALRATAVMNIASRLVDRAAQAGDTPALIDVARGQPRITSFAQLDDASARGAALLLDARLPAGRRRGAAAPHVVRALRRVDRGVPPRAGRGRAGSVGQPGPPGRRARGPAAHRLHRRPQGASAASAPSVAARVALGGEPRRLAADRAVVACLARPGALHAGRRRRRRRSRAHHLHQRQHQHAQGGGAVARVPARPARRARTLARSCSRATSISPRCRCSCSPTSGRA